MASDVDGQGMDRLVSEIRALSERSLAVQADVTVAADRYRLVKTSLDTFGRADILINNAGIIHICDPLKMTEEEWDRVQGVNLKGTYFMCQAILPQMLKRGGGRIT